MSSDLFDLSTTKVKALSLVGLDILAQDIRQFIIDITSKRGGHVGSALGVVELTIALHYVFDSPNDPILFDTGHQGYVHRILTGRANQFPSLNTFGGMSRFLDRADSPCDVLSASHAGTAVSTAVGLAQAMRARGDTHRVVAVVGDGTLGEGETWEGLNYLAGTDLSVIVVLNDNGFSIPPTVGGIANLGWEREHGWGMHDFCEALGFLYWSVSDGHVCKDLIEIFDKVRFYHGPQFVHVKTEKGRGLPCAATHPYKMHFSMPFDPETGAGASPTVTGRTYATVAAETLGDVLEHDPAVVVLTPGTPYASGLEPLLARYPDRVLDVGMAEAHAVSMAAGLAIGGQKPVVCIQSTFLQRAYDQVLHDVCFPDLAVTFLVVRSGFAGYDGPTHHGLYDIPVLRSFPNMQLHYAMDTQDVRDVLTRRMTQPEGPLALLMPYEPVHEPEPAFTWRDEMVGLVGTLGGEGTLLCLGNTVSLAMEVQQGLGQHGRQFGILVIGQLKPFTRFARIRDILSPDRTPLRLVTLEEGMLAGGFGSLIAERFAGHAMPIDLLRCGVDDTFVPAGSQAECRQHLGLDADTIVRRIL